MGGDGIFVHVSGEEGSLIWLEACGLYTLNLRSSCLLPFFCSCLDDNLQTFVLLRYIPTPKTTGTWFAYMFSQVQKSACSSLVPRSIA